MQHFPNTESTHPSSTVPTPFPYLHIRRAWLIDAHPHQSVLSIYHPLEAQTNLCTGPPRQSSGAIGRRPGQTTGLDRRTTTSPISAITARSRAPRGGILLGGALYDGRVMQADPLSNSPPLERDRVQIIISPPLMAEPPGDLRSGGSRRPLRHQVRRNLRSPGPATRRSSKLWA